jgi:hypothetical protein
MGLSGANDACPDFNRSDDSKTDQGNLSLTGMHLLTSEAVFGFGV